MSGSEVHEITIESETLNGRTVYRPRCKCGDFEGGTYLHRNGAWRVGNGHIQMQIAARKEIR